ncbi:MAG: FHA domain-containing protein [Prevotella sp.]|nr:FHA domain-containing protein [Prevotella sp.]
MVINIGIQGNQPFPLAETSISRHHAVFQKDDRTGRMTLRDNGSTNGTYILKNGTFQRINGEVQVGMETIVRLGAEFTFRIKDLFVSKAQPKPKPKETIVDISNLRNVYEAYNHNKMSIEAKTSNIMMWRMMSMSLGGIFGVVLSMLLPEDLGGDPVVGNIIKVLGTVIAIGIAWLIVDVMNKDLIRRKDQNERYFRKKYCCPKCGYHFGQKLYDNILAEGKCPNRNCMCKYTGK